VTELAATSMATFAALQSARSGEPILLHPERHMDAAESEQRQQIVVSG